jgi:pimeloyl-ACP methyl ester carboxylesterase
LVRIDNVAGLPALIVEPDATQSQTPVLLFLHGKGEAGSSANEIPKVCVHQTPPFQAILGRLPGATIIAPQAPPRPNENDWNWAEHVKGLAGFFSTGRFAGHRLMVTGFSRGGLGALQLVSAFPSLASAWAVVDSSPGRNDEEASAILSSPAMRRGWVRYGADRRQNKAWRKFSSALAERIPPENYAETELSHTEMALAADCGQALSDSGNNLYEFLKLEFRKPNEIEER